MIALKEVEVLFREAAEYFYECRGIINSDFDTERFKLYEYEIHSLKVNKGWFVKKFCYDVYMNLKIYREKLTFIVGYLTYVKQEKLEEEVLKASSTYLFNCDNLANTEMYIFMKQIKPKIQDYEGPFGAVEKPRKKPGRPTEKTRDAKLNQQEAAQLFYIFAETGIIGFKTKAAIANDMNMITGWNIQDSRAKMNLKAGLSKASKDKIVKLLHKAIEMVGNYTQSR